MRVTYDPYADAVYIDIARGKGTLETKMLDDWVAVDIGADCSVIGFEILDASSRLDVEKLKTLEFEILGPPIISGGIAGGRTRRYPRERSRIRTCAE